VSVPGWSIVHARRDDTTTYVVLSNHPRIVRSPTQFGAGFSKARLVSDDGRSLDVSYNWGVLSIGWSEAEVESADGRPRAVGCDEEGFRSQGREFSLKDGALLVVRGYGPTADIRQYDQPPLPPAQSAYEDWIAWTESPEMRALLSDEGSDR
jgi:hypothetical protein